MQDQASALISNPPAEVQADAERRQDLTHHEVVTIDDAGTRDVDDGLSVETLPSGQHRLWVHIADPSRWVNPNDALDVEARSRAKTIYLPTGQTPDALCHPCMLCQDPCYECALENAAEPRMFAFPGLRSQSYVMQCMNVYVWILAQDKGATS